MPKYVCVVFSGPVDGREEEFNTWYNEKHIYDVLAVPGCMSAQRFRYADAADKENPGTYLALYEWEIESVEAARAALAEARESGEVDVDSSLDPAKTATFYYEAIGDPIDAA